MHAGLARNAKGGELGAWRQFKVFSPVKMGTRTEGVAETRRAVTWEEMEGKEAVKARLGAKNYQVPDLEDGNVDFGGLVGRRSPNLHLVSLGASGKWETWSLGNKNASRQADGSDRGVSVRAPCEWDSRDNRRIWRLRVPACGLNDAPVVFHRALRKYVANSVESLSNVSLKFEAASFGPRFCSFFRKSGRAVGATTTHMGDNPGSDEPDPSLRARRFLGNRLGKSQLREKSFVRVSIEVAQEDDFVAAST